MILQADDELEAVSTSRLLTIMCNDIRLAFITDEIKAQSYENFLCILRDSIQVRQEASMKCVCGFSEEQNEGEEFIEITLRTSELFYTNANGDEVDRDGIQDVYACPKCGTLKIEVKK